MGRAKATLARRTSVKAWAETTVFLGGGHNKKYLNFFAEAGSDVIPTTFHACLTKGIPMPRLRHSSGEAGPALKIEREVPGSLKWLIHPLWSTFDSPCESIFEIHRLMAALPPTVTDRLFDAESPLLRRRGRALKPFCEELCEVETLDSLAALIYCGYEGALTNDLAVVRAVERTLRQRVMDWRGLQHLSDHTKRCLSVLCRDAVDASDVQPSRRDEAAWAVATEIVAQRYRGEKQEDMLGGVQDVAYLEQVLRAP